MPEDRTKRRQRIDQIVDQAVNGVKKPKPKPKKANPYPEGSARYKLFERKLRENQSTDSNQ